MKPRRNSTKRGELGKSGTEAAHVKRVKAAGGVSLKFKSPGRKGAPDRLDLYGLEPVMAYVEKLIHDVVACEVINVGVRARRILAAAIQFTETKATGKKPRADQQRFHKMLRNRGFTVNVVDR